MKKRKEMKKKVKEETMSQSVLIVSINIKMDKPIVHFDVREKSRGKPTSPTM